MEYITSLTFVFLEIGSIKETPNSSRQSTSEVSVIHITPQPRPPPCSRLRIGAAPMFYVRKLLRGGPQCSRYDSVAGSYLRDRVL